MKTEIAVIGGGASGLMAAITAKKSGKEVVILERKDRILKKVLITGNGRCNITNDMDILKFIDMIESNKKFMYKAFTSFTNRDIVSLLNRNGLETKVERGRKNISSY